MSARRCSHQHRVPGIVQCDLSRTDGGNSVYSAHFSVNICTDCGYTDLYCESHKAVCDWLAKKSARRSPAQKKF